MVEMVKLSRKLRFWVYHKVWFIFNSFVFSASGHHKLRIWKFKCNVHHWCTFIKCFTIRFRFFLLWTLWTTKFVFFHQTFGNQRTFSWNYFTTHCIKTYEVHYENSNQRPFGFRHSFLLLFFISQRLAHILRTLWKKFKGLHVFIIFCFSL